jgi:uncharacterized protein YegP (UPF0339 family)
MYAITMKSPYTIEVWRGLNEMWYFHVSHRNGKVICTSEGYTRRNRAVLAAQKLSLNLSNAQFIIK